MIGVPRNPWCYIVITDPWYGSEEKCGYTRNEPTLATLQRILELLGYAWEPETETLTHYSAYYRFIQQKHIKLDGRKAVNDLRQIAPLELAQYAASICGLEDLALPTALLGG